MNASQDIFRPIARTLVLDVGGQPIRWVDWREAIALLTGAGVAWTYGQEVACPRGGRRADGSRSMLSVPAVLARRARWGAANLHRPPPLSNPLLFQRDRNLCLYCGARFRPADLSRDHVTPLCKGGRDAWTNAVTACRRCNQRKGGRAPAEAGMALLAVPYAPSHAEGLLLAERRVLADQMQFLLSHVPEQRRGQWLEH